MKKFLAIFGTMFLALLISYVYFLKPKIPVLTGYAVKQMCSGIFVSGLNQDEIQTNNLYFTPVKWTSSKVDFQNKLVESSLWGLGKQKAIFKAQLGCVQIHGEDDYNLTLDINRSETDTIDQLNRIFKKVKGVDYRKLDNALSYAFNLNEKKEDTKTLAVAVFYKDTLVAEKYSAGYKYSTPIMGWSMTKSVTNALIGILIKNNKLALTETNLLSKWASDERNNISINDLLQMQSGLDFDENYEKLSDATKMLFMSEDVSEIPSNQSLKHPIGSHWAYSSGTTNILSRIIRNQFITDIAYHRFPYDSLFNRIGMVNTTMETDESGTFVGSSFCYGSARDWGRFGLLYLNKGNWWGDKILDTSWVEFSQQVNEQSNGIYGAHFWQNKGHSSFKNAPEDLYFCNGFQGQMVAIIPSYDLVIVRLGLADSYDKENFFKFLFDSFAPIN